MQSSLHCTKTVFSCQAAICRSSQPLSGFSARCLEDEQMLEAIMKSNPNSQFMYVVDTRPKVSKNLYLSVVHVYKIADVDLNIPGSFSAKCNG